MTDLCFQTFYVSLDTALLLFYICCQTVEEETVYYNFHTLSRLKDAILMQKMTSRRYYVDLN